jgi:hypothetical protein
MKKLLLAAVTAAVFSIGVAQGGIQSGDTELQVQGSLQTSSSDESDATTTTAMAQLGLNHYFTTWFSLGVSLMPNISETSSDGGDDQTSSSIFLMVRPDFYFGTENRVVPYVGPHVGLASYSVSGGNGDSSYDNSGTVAAGGLHGGMKIFASERASWNVEINGTTYTEESNESDESSSVNVIAFLVGMTYRF